MLLKLAWRNIFRNKRRSLITTSSVAFAVVFAVVMRSLQMGAYDNMIQNIVGSYLGYVQVHHKGYWEQKTLDNAMNLDSAKDLADIQMSPRIEGYALCSKQDLSKPVLVLGLNPSIESEMIGLEQKLVEGSYFNNGEGILIAKDLKAFLDVDLGDTIILFGQGFQGSIAAGQYPIAGVIDLKTPELNKRTLILPISEAAKLFAMEGYATSLVLQSEEMDWENMYQEAQSSLDTSQFEVMSWKQMLPELVQLIRADSAGGLVVIGILYMIIAFGLFGTVLMLTEERKFEFGVMVAIGMKKNKLKKVLIIETLLMTLTGVISGLLIAFPITFYFHFNPLNLSGELQEAVERFGFEAVLPTSIDPKIALFQALIVLLLALIVGMYAVYKVSKLKPVEAMKQ